jgi:hypothetical protein
LLETTNLDPEFERFSYFLPTHGINEDSNSGIKTLTSWRIFCTTTVFLPSRIRNIDVLVLYRKSGHPHVGGTGLTNLTVVFKKS